MIVPVPEHDSLPDSASLVLYPVTVTLHVPSTSRFIFCFDVDEEMPVNVSVTDEVPSTAVIT